jgi:hypothetical protein
VIQVFLPCCCFITNWLHRVDIGSTVGKRRMKGGGAFSWGWLARWVVEAHWSVISWDWLSPVYVRAGAAIASALGTHHPGASGYREQWTKYYSRYVMRCVVALLLIPLLWCDVIDISPPAGAPVEQLSLVSWSAIGLESHTSSQTQHCNNRSNMWVTQCWSYVTTLLYCTIQCIVSDTNYGPLAENLKQYPQQL